MNEIVPAPQRASGAMASESVLRFLPAQVARADENRDTQIKAEMVQNYLLWQEAYKNKDAERIISFESPDFTDVSERGEVTEKAQSDEIWRNTMNAVIKINAANIAIKKVSIEKNRVVVWNKQYVSGEGVDDSKETIRFNSIEYTKDIWVEYDGIWMLKRVEHLDSKNW